MNIASSKLSLIFACVVGLLCSPAQANPITYDFLADVYNLRTSVGSGDISGQMLRGSFTYNPDRVSESSVIGDPAHWTDYDFLSGARLSVTWDSFHLTQQIERGVVANDYNPVSGYFLDRFFLSTLKSESLTNGYWMQLWVDGFTQSPSGLLGSTGLPASNLDLSLANLDASPVVINTPDWQASAKITSLKLRTTSVPEPSSASLLIVGLLALTLRNRLRFFPRCQ